MVSRKKKRRRQHLSETATALATAATALVVSKVRYFHGTVTTAKKKEAHLAHCFVLLGGGFNHFLKYEYSSYKHKQQTTFQTKTWPTKDFFF